MPELLRVAGERVAAFYCEREREALRSFYAFPVVWNEQCYDVAAYEGEEILGAAQVRIAASLAHIDRIIVVPERRRAGIGRALIEELADIANYYNCHKICAQAVAQTDAERFYEACGYHREALLPQHTFKLDIALLRKYLL